MKKTKIILAIVFALLSVGLIVAEIMTAIEFISFLNGRTGLSSLYSNKFFIISLVVISVLLIVSLTMLILTIRKMKIKDHS